MVDVTNLEKLRTCGRLETYSTARHHLGIYKNVGLTATYTSSAATLTSLETLVFGALRGVLAKHAILGAIPLNEEKSYPDVYFARIPEIDFRTCVEFHQREDPLPRDGETDAELDALLVEQHNRDFKDELGSKPFWRLIILTSTKKPNEFSVSWFFHHALADGTSAFLFHESFLAALNSAAPEADADPIFKSLNTALFPPLEELHSMSISWPFFIKAVLGTILPSIFAKRPMKLWTGNPVPAEIDLAQPIHYRTLVFSAETTSKLAQASRKEKTSVTATLQCLLAASLFASVPAAECEKIKIASPMSMRRFLDGVAEDQITNAITQYGYLHQRLAVTSTDEAAKVEVLQYFSWDEARAVKAEIQTELAKEGWDNPIALLKYVSDMPRFFLEQLGKPRSPTLELSNIGVFRVTKTEMEMPWKIGRMTFSQTPNMTSCPICVNVVTGMDGNAVVNFSWREGAVEMELMEHVLECVSKGVEGLTTDPRP
ncbi:uncharacterized protein K460DRAFT_276437 [Cucurbitaria berberidis CBS 394.84]|uniref:Alcohol acetyltransferase n=1 Tax=Cucurbitaria berberidis CBS 394.84 TaxID=1168544 RepID=A0A9P4LA29_9PLEO|nr:uncharacterized protein K460DRAFT_276437 [Cucurbitaria berberidis CBS 394.84]KAF1847655.1 hypothetical protein K460DRAFT_276437 [Cucurbitaria berberidis CBS 394.84]